MLLYVKRALNETSSLNAVHLFHWSMTMVSLLPCRHYMYWSFFCLTKPAKFSWSCWSVVDSRLLQICWSIANVHHLVAHIKIFHVCIKYYYQLLLSQLFHVIYLLSTAIKNFFGVLKPWQPSAFQNQNKLLQVFVD